MSEEQCVNGCDLVNNGHIRQIQTTETVGSSVTMSPLKRNTNEILSSGSSEPEPKLFQSIVLISETSLVNIMTIPRQVTEQLKMRIQNTDFSPNQLSEKLLHIAKLEIAFILSKECVSLWYEYNTLQNMRDPPLKKAVFIEIQVGYFFIPFYRGILIYIEM